MDFYMRFNSREGSRKISLTNDNTPSTAKPSKRKGNNNSHIMGYRISAIIAKGAHSANNINQSRKVIIANQIYYTRKIM